MSITPVDAEELIHSSDQQRRSTVAVRYDHRPWWCDCGIGVFLQLVGRGLAGGLIWVIYSASIGMNVQRGRIVGSACLADIERKASRARALVGAAVAGGQWRLCRHHFPGQEWKSAG